jgi:F0F1-type ATP synthase alpha subunit
LNLSKPAPKLHPDKIVNATSQIFTGNIAVDYTNTIGEGNFVLIEGKPNTGKFTLCFNTAFNFLQDKGEYAAVVYFGLNRKDADQLSDLCKPKIMLLTKKAPN